LIKKRDKWQMDKLEGSNGLENIFFMIQPLTHLFSTLIDFSPTFPMPSTFINALHSGKVETLMM
jgi:hypothetical protein